MPGLTRLRNGSRKLNGILISVIIPALNEEKVIGQCLGCLVQQKIHKDQFEVIVVDNGSVDRTLEIARGFGGSLNLRILQKPSSHISALRNLGASSAKGEFLAFLDADCLASEEWLSRAIELLRSGDGGVVGAFYTIPEGSSWLAKAWYRDLPIQKQGRVSYVPSGTLFVSQSFFSKIKGFDETLQTSEDFEFCQRVAATGYNVLSSPALSTVHLGTPQTLSAFYRKQRWHGNGVRTAFLRDMFHPGFAKTVLQTAAMLILLITSAVMVPVAVLTNKLFLLTVAPALVLFGSFVLAARAAAVRKAWSFLFPLTLLYLVYGIARSLSFLGLNGKRAACPGPSPAYGACAETTPAD